MEGIKQDVCEYCEALSATYTVDFPTHTTICCIHCLEEYQDVSHTIGGECPLCPEFETDIDINKGDIIRDVTTGIVYGVSGVGDKNYLVRELPDNISTLSKYKITYTLLNKKLAEKIIPSGFIKKKPSDLAKTTERKEWNGIISYFDSSGSKEVRKFTIIDSGEKNRFLWSMEHFDGKPSIYEKLTKEEIAKKFNFYTEYLKAVIQVPGYIY